MVKRGSITIVHNDRVYYDNSTLHSVFKHNFPTIPHPPRLVPRWAFHVCLKSGIEQLMKQHVLIKSISTDESFILFISNFLQKFSKTLSSSLINESNDLGSGITSQLS